MNRINHTAIGAAVVHFHKLEKQGADTPDLSYGLTGRLYLSQSGWLMLSVPNALGRGAFQALNAPGVELPVHGSSGQYNAHISVMRPEEVLKCGGPDKVLERGKELSFTLGPVREVNPEGWDEMERAWFIEVRSPDLEKLRKSYGLSALPNNNKYNFHITFAVRRKHVTRDNNLMMRRVGDMIRNPSKYFDDKYTRKEASTGWEVKDSAIHGKGLFATKEFGPADVIASGGHFAPDGTFVRGAALKPINHSKRPNAVVRLEDDELVIVADDLITPGEELTLDYVDAYSVLGIDVQFEDGSGIESNNDVLEKKSENRWLKVIKEVVEDDACADVKNEDCRPDNNPQPPRSSPRSPSKDQQAQIQRSAIEEQQSSQKLAASGQNNAALSFEFVCSGCGQPSGDCAGCPGNIRLIPEHEFKKKAAEPKQYRERAEIFGLTPRNEVYGGVWDNDKSFAVPGGGIDPGEDVLKGAEREFLEETGLTLKNPRLAGIPPITKDWSEKHRMSLPDDRKHFHGTRTHYVLGDLPDSVSPARAQLDHWGATDKRPYTIDEALRLMEGKTPMSPVHYEARRQLLQTLRQLAASKLQTKQASQLDSYEVEAFKNEPLIGRPGADLSNYAQRLQSRANRIQKEELAASRMQAALKGDFGYSQSQDYWAGRTPQRPKLLHQLTDMAMRRNAGQ